MSEGEPNPGEKPLEDEELSTELRLLLERNILPQKIIQRIGEKLREKNIKITKNQLYRLTEKIQSTLQTYTPSSQHQPTPEERKETQRVSNAFVQSTDMKKLLDAMDQLNQRIKIIEEYQIQGVKAETGKLLRTKDIKTFESPDFPEEHIQPLEHTPSDPESIVVIMKWLQFLVDKTGKNNLPNTLGYYVDIGWISEDVRLDLMNYSKGITEDPAQANTHQSLLPTRDHLQSLLFIQKLKGYQLDDRFLNKIDREMEKIIKSLEGYLPK